MNLVQIEQAYIQRVKPLVGSMPVMGTFDDLDWTAEAAPRVGVQVTYDGLTVADEAAQSALVFARFTASVFLDMKRSSASDRTAATTALMACMRAALGWEQPNYRTAQLADGDRTSFDGRLLRVSVSFIVPAFASALVGA